MFSLSSPMRPSSASTRNLLARVVPSSCSSPLQLLVNASKDTLADSEADSGQATVRSAIDHKMSTMDGPVQYTSLRSVPSDETCTNDTASENETLDDFTSSSPEAGVDELVQHLIDGAQRVADVDELLEAALKSFEMIAKRYAETPPSGDGAFVSVADGARAAGRDYVESVKDSVKVAQLGVAFAADVINLCDCCSKGIEIDIHSFVDDMRTMVQQALDEAITTNRKFRDIRRRLLQLTREIPVQQRRIEERHNNHQHNSNAQDHIGALKLLEKAFDDISLLVEAVAKFADWWCQAKTMVSMLKRVMFINYPRTDLDRLGVARKGWKSVRDRYEVYIRTVDTLADYYPADNMRTSVSLFTALKEFTRMLTVYIKHWLGC